MRLVLFALAGGSLWLLGCNSSSQPEATRGTPERRFESSQASRSPHTDSAMNLPEGHPPMNLPAGHPPIGPAAGAGLAASETIDALAECFRYHDPASGNRRYYKALNQRG